MIESELYYLVKSYRDAIEQAHKKNRFCKWPFNQFPEACCGQASDILARFLGEQGIYTKVVSGSDSNTTHAWLVLDDSILQDRKSTRLNSSHSDRSRMPSSA